MNTAQAINGEISTGDWVMVTAPNYHYLIGQVTEITPRTSPKHDFENQATDIHVNFIEVEYTETVKADLLKAFARFNPQAKTFNELPLDDVVIAPENLIRISGVEISDTEYTIFEEILDSRDAAQAFCDQVLSSVHTEKITQLMERFNTNFADYRKSLMDFSKDEIISKADKIAATTAAHEYMTSIHGYDDIELDFFLKFQNPLDVVSEEWRKRNDEIDDMSYQVDNIIENRKFLLSQHPLQNPPDKAVDVSDVSESEHKKIVQAVREMEYGIGAKEFEKQVSNLFPAGSRDTTLSWISHAEYSEQELSHPQAKSLLEYVVEFGLIKQHYGDEIALQVFNLAEQNCPNVFELRGAAKLLKDGVDISDVHDLVLEQELYMTEAEDYEFGKALIGFVERESMPVPTKHIHTGEQNAKPLDKPAAKPKQSLGEKLHAAGEKAKAQSVQHTNDKPNKKNERC